VSASAIAGILKARPDGLLFQCDLSGKIIQCGIAEAALRDLVDLFHVSGSKEETFRAVLSEMQHIVNTNLIDSKATAGSSFDRSIFSATDIGGGRILRPERQRPGACSPFGRRPAAVSSPRDTECFLSVRRQVAAASAFRLRTGSSMSLSLRISSGNRCAPIFFFSTRSWV